jgi:hypothetical protein
MSDVTESTAAPSPLHLRLLPAFIGDTAHSKSGYILKGWLLTLLPSLALAALVGMLFSAYFGEAQGPRFPEVGPWLLAFLLVVFTPILETLAMVPPLLLLNRWLGSTPAVMLSAIGWGIVHSLRAPIWGLVAWWPFLVFSAIILAWREKGLLTGMLIVTMIHGMQNAVPALLLLAAGKG